MTNNLYIDHIIINQYTKNMENSSGNLYKKDLQHIDTQTTIPANDKSLSSYNFSQDILENFFTTFSIDINNIKKLNADFKEFDNLMKNI